MTLERIATGVALLIAGIVTAYVCVGVAIMLVRSWLRRHLGPRHCPKCGYDLSGNTTGVRPECGEAKTSARFQRGSAAASAQASRGNAAHVL